MAFFPSEGARLIDWSRWYIVELIKELNTAGMNPTTNELIAELEKRISADDKIRSYFYLGLARSPETVLDSMSHLGFIDHTGDRYRITTSGERVLNRVWKQKPEPEVA